MKGGDGKERLAKGMDKFLKTMVNSYPNFIISFFFLVGSFQGQLIGFVYLISILILIIICGISNNVFYYVFYHVFKNTSSQSNVEEYAAWFNAYQLIPLAISPQSAISWFTFIYLVLPMFFQNIIIINWVVFLLLGAFAIINSIATYQSGPMQPVVLGGLTGLMIGIISVIVIRSFINPRLLFTREVVTNNAICSRPSRQSFKCEVWKGQELISTSIT